MFWDRLVGLVKIVQVLGVFANYELDVVNVCLFHVPPLL